MTKRLTALTLAVLTALPAAAAPACERKADAMALKTAALQQEMMVAAFVCKAAGAYNDFVLSHRSQLQASDHTLLAFFVTANPRGGFDDYNLFKTELANAASLRSMRDLMFCARVAANFAAVAGRPLEQVLNLLPNPVGTGPIHCRTAEATPPPHLAVTQR